MKQIRSHFTQVIVGNVDSRVCQFVVFDLALPSRPFTICFPAFPLLAFCLCFYCWIMPAAINAGFDSASSLNIYGTRNKRIPNVKCVLRIAYWTIFSKTVLLDEEKFITRARTHKLEQCYDNVYCTQIIGVSPPRYTNYYFAMFEWSTKLKWFAAIYFAVLSAYSHSYAHGSKISNHMYFTWCATCERRLVVIGRYIFWWIPTTRLTTSDKFGILDHVIFHVNSIPSLVHSILYK